MPKIQLLLTFDYELPLGSSQWNFDEALFSKGENLLEICKEKNLKTVQFIDILSYIKFKTWGIEEYAIKFKKQVQDFVKNGHEIQLHLHPHWMTSDYKNGKVIASKDYVLASFPNQIDSIIQFSIDTIEEICREVKPDYKCIAYRGGGYHLAPETKTILDELKRNGICYDSSISKGYYFKSNLTEIDYTITPKSNTWELGYDLKSSGNSGITEIPIASIPKKLLELPTFVKMKLHPERIPKGSGSMIHEKANLSVGEKIKKIQSHRMLTFDNYTYNEKYLMKILDHNINLYSSEESIKLAAIGHPKSLGDYNFELFQSFIDLSRNKYGEDISFVGFEDL